MRIDVIEPVYFNKGDKGTVGTTLTSDEVIEPTASEKELSYTYLPYTNPLGVVKVDKDYVYEGTPVQASCGKGVEIEGFLFLPDEIKGNESYRRRNYQRTKIMSGGEFVSRTSYVPREYSFTTMFDVDEDEPYHYDALFTYMENKKCKVISPYISSNPFYAAVEIQKTQPKSTPAAIKVEVKLTEIPDAKLRISGDDEITYPDTTKLSDGWIKVKETSDTSDGGSGEDQDGKFMYGTSKTHNFDGTS